VAVKIQHRLREAVDAIGKATSSLDRLDQARRLREQTELLEQELVRVAREDGQSWTQIGALYGLTKQGAQQRFRRPPRDALGD